MDYDSVLRKMAIMFELYLAKRGAQLELTPNALVNQIKSYIYLRERMSTHDISDPPTQPLKPAGWTLMKEAIWRDWIHYSCPPDSWRQEVIGPIFGSDDVEDWCDEILHYLPWWIRRSDAIVAKFDPTPLEEEVEEDKMKGLDQYLIDHGSAKQRRKAAEY